MIGVVGEDGTRHGSRAALRRKLERDPHAPVIVQTVVGAGYRLGLAADG